MTNRDTGAKRWERIHPAWLQKGRYPERGILRYFTEKALLHVDQNKIMELAVYSISIILSYSFARWFTENFKLHLRNNKFWFHHWILAAVAMAGLYLFEVDDAWLWGALTGIALEGLRRKNWSILRQKNE